MCCSGSCPFLVVSFSQCCWGQGVRSCPEGGIFGVSQGSIVSPFLFNFYMKPLANVICQFGIWHHHDTNNTQMYISTLGCADEVVNLLTQPLQGLDEAKRFQLNPPKTERLWLFVHTGSGMFPSLVLDGTALPHSRQVYNWGPSCLEEHVAAVAIFCTGLSVCQLCPFLSWKVLFMVTHAFVISSLDY